MIIYKATNLINDKIYIGKTVKSLNERIAQHKYDSLTKDSQTKIHRAIRKYGWDNFKWEVIDTDTTNENLLNKEIYYIKLYNTIDSGYNITEGGEGICGLVHTQETKNKISESRKGKCTGEKHPMYGKTLSEYAKKKISESNTTREITDKFRETMSNVTKGNKNGMSKLNDEKVLEIKKLLTSGKYSQVKIAEMFDVSKYAIHDIKRGKTWSHIVFDEKGEIE